MRPTTKDLAEAAGVSLATVDRVLNARSNVSKKSIQKVNQAIERIGFVRNVAAVNLVRNKTYKFQFILPTRGDQYLNELLDQVVAAHDLFQQDMTLVSVVQLPMNDPHAVANHLALIDPASVDGVALMAPESPQVRDAMARLDERGIKVVQFLSGQEKLNDLDFVGIDNFAAGATAGRLIGRFMCGQHGKVMVISETMQSLDSIQRRLGFDSVINERFSTLVTLPSLETYGDPDRTQRIIARQLEHHDDIIALYVMNSEARVPLEHVAQSKDLKDLTIVVHERTPYSQLSLLNEDIDAVIAQNPGQAVRRAIRILRARCDNVEPTTPQENLRIEVLLKDNL